MPSSYYTPTGNPVAQNRGTSPAMRAEFALIDTALQKLPSPQAINSAAGNYVNDTGTANAYVVAMAAQITALTAGLEVSFKANSANTGASTLTITGVAANIPIVGPDGATALSAGAITPGMIVDVRYDGASFQFRSGMLAGTQSPAAIQQQTYTAATTGGTSTAYTAAPTPTFTQYLANQTLYLTFHVTCGDSPTINISGLGAIALLRELNDGSYIALKAGEVLTGHRSKVTLLSGSTALVEALEPRLEGSYNRIINGACLISQYGTKTLAATGSIYGGCDRFLNTVSATTVSATIQQSASPSPTGPGAQGFAQLVTVTSTGATTMGWSQRIEAKHCSDMNGLTVTFKCSVYQNTGAPVNFSGVISKANSLDAFGSMTVLTGGAPVSVPSGVPTVVSMTVTLAATDASNGLQIGVSSGSMGALTSKSFWTSDWWFDIGSAIPSAVEKVDATREFIRCARYFYTTTLGTPTGAAAGGHGGVGTATNVLTGPLRYPVPMRISPAVTLWRGGTQNQVRVTATAATVSATLSAPAGPSVQGFSALVMSATPLTAGVGYDFDISADAEL